MSIASETIRARLDEHDRTHGPLIDCPAQDEGLLCCIDLLKFDFDKRERIDNPFRVALETLLQSEQNAALARSDALNSAANTLEDNNYDAVTYLRSTAKEWLGIAERNKKETTEEERNLVNSIGPRKTVRLYDENQELLGVFAVTTHIKNGDTITLSFPVKL